MSDNPLDAIYEFAEQTYLRMQANDVLMRCLELKSRDPIHELVEELILAGPESISAMRETLAEADQRRAEVQDELHRAFVDLQGQCHDQGLQISGMLDAFSLTYLPTEVLRDLMREQGIDQEETQVICLRLLQKSRGAITRLVTQLGLLQEIQNYLQDWLWGLAYQSCHHKNQGDFSRPANLIH